ncbi:MAG: Rrf2 family transcriptional regulator [Clostridiales bacterium]|jgi:Rrf2 family protein|nr:Rrf2 family transcriptional regulator [Clostridiales bacterium]
MKISTRSRYGLRAMVELASQGENRCITLKNIAEKHGMSEYYLEQLFAPLKKAGLATSVRGAQGGYKLGKPAAEVSAGDVLRALEGSLSPVDCLEDESASCAAANCDNCSTKTVWARLHAGMSEVLDTIRLSELAAESDAV